MSDITAFIARSVLLGLGLSADAFSVSVANGLASPQMSSGRIILIAGTFALFQAAMPMVGWLFAHTASECLDGFAVFIPWIAAVLLLFIGGKMILDCVRSRAGPVPTGTGRGAAFSAPADAGSAAAGAAAHRAAAAADTLAPSGASSAAFAAGSAAAAANAPAANAAGALPTQAIATSIDALSAGFAAAGQPLALALFSAGIIGAVTFVVCTLGLLLGKSVGKALAGKAQLLGGIILILLGVKIAFS